MSDRLSPEAEALLADAKDQEPKPTGADRARAHALIAAALLAPPPAPAAPPAPVPGAAEMASTGLGAGAKWVIGSLLAGAVAVTAVIVTQDSPAPDPMTPQVGEIQAPLPEPPKVDTPAPVIPAASDAVKEAPHKPSVPRKIPVKPKVTREVVVQDAADSLEAETALLFAARRAVRAGALADATKALATHEAEHPSGVLVEERMVLQAMVACRTGDRARAAALSAELEKRPSGAAYRARISAACDAQDPQTGR